MMFRPVKGTSQAAVRAHLTDLSEHYCAGLPCSHLHSSSLGCKAPKALDLLVQVAVRSPLVRLQICRQDTAMCDGKHQRAHSQGTASVLGLLHHGFTVGPQAFG